MSPTAPLGDTARGFHPDSVVITAFTSAGSTLWRSAASRTMRSIGSVDSSVGATGGAVANSSAVAGIAGGAGGCTARCDLAVAAGSVLASRGASGRGEEAATALRLACGCELEFTKVILPFWSTEAAI